MIKKRKFTNNSLWWLDINILNTNNILFTYLTESNLFTLQLSKSYYYYYFVINRNNLNSLYFFNLDATVVNVGDFNNYYITTQTIISDFKILIAVLFTNNLQSLSQIYLGNTWIEREVREFYGIFFTNLLDSRKLLLNYNYNHNLNYNQFNGIVYDMSI